MLGIMYPFSMASSSIWSEGGGGGGLAGEKQFNRSGKEVWTGGMRCQIKKRRSSQCLSIS